MRSGLHLVHKVQGRHRVGRLRLRLHAPTPPESCPDGCTACLFPLLYSHHGMAVHYHSLPQATTDPRRRSYLHDLGCQLGRQALWKCPEQAAMVHVLRRRQMLQGLQHLQESQQQQSSA